MSLMLAEAGAYALAGGDADLLLGRSALLAATGAFGFDGAAASTLISRLLTATAAPYDLAGAVQLGAPYRRRRRETAIVIHAMTRPASGRDEHRPANV